MILKVEAGGLGKLEKTHGFGAGANRVKPARNPAKSTLARLGGKRLFVCRMDDLRAGGKVHNSQWRRLLIPHRRDVVEDQAKILTFAWG